jgi:DNA invertase Pin-like site-specific DNA recombinase
VPRFRVETVPRKRTLPEPTNGSTLPIMVGAVIYVRVSTKEQTENLSLPTQLRACEEYCRRQGYEVLERFHEEGESAKTTDRSQLQNLLTYCRLNKGRVHFVVVFNLTRFARDKYDHFALRSHLQSLGISLRSATEPIDDTSTGKLMEGVLAAFAQFDNDCRSDRTRAGMKAALELGRWVFLAPIGYLNAPRAMGKSLMADPERAPIVRRVFEKYATGRYTKQSEVLQQARAGPDEPPESFAHIASDWSVAEQSALRRHRGRPRVRRACEARRLRTAHYQRLVLPRPVGPLRPNAEHRATPSESPGLPAARLRGVRTRTHRKLVDGAASRFEVTLREGSPRAGLQVAFEADGSLLIRELNDDVTSPRLAREGVWATARVVVRQSRIHVGRETDIEVWALVRVLEHVDESLVSGHGARRWQSQCR